MQKKFKVNVTLCFSPSQALLAAKAGATFISPFIGRLDDVGENGVQLIQDIKTIYKNLLTLLQKICITTSIATVSVTAYLLGAIKQ